VRVNLIIIDGNMEKPTIRDKCRNYKLGTDRKTEMTMNDTTPILTIIISTCMKLAQLKP
jgi:hypothetical protein